jgi:hypothetical protein
MRDDFDILMSQSIKRWSARQKPRPGGREQLLWRAVHLQEYRPAPRPWWALLLPINLTAYPYTSTADWLVGPFTQTRTYWLHTATTYRVVA